MKKYMLYLDDGHDVFKVFVPAKNEKMAREFVKGNGEVVAVKDVTEDYLISADKVASALRNACFGKAEIDFILRSLVEFNIAN